MIISHKYYNTTHFDDEFIKIKTRKIISIFFCRLFFNKIYRKNISFFLIDYCFNLIQLKNFFFHILKQKKEFILIFINENHHLAYYFEKDLI